MDEQLFPLQLLHLLFVGCDHARRACLKDAFEQLFDLPFDLDDFCAERLRLGRALHRPAIPEALEHILDDLERGSAWRHGLKQLLEFLLDPVAANRLAIAGTAAFRAEVIGVIAMRPLRPAGGERAAAIAATDEATKREILIEVLSSRSAANALQTVLDALVGLEADKRLMLADPQRHAPFRGFDIPGIDALVQQDMHPLVPDALRPVLGEQGVLLQEAHDIGLVLEAAQSVAFKRFLNDRGDRLIALKHPAAAGHALILVTCRRLEHPIAVHEAGAHAVLGLFAVLLALVLRDAGEQVFDQHRVGVFAELDGGRFQNAACVGNRAAQLKVSLQAPRQT
nr:hypothetical protein [Azospirillum fermentarium]